MIRVTYHYVCDCCGKEAAESDEYRQTASCWEMLQPRNVPTCCGRHLCPDCNGKVQLHLDALSNRLQQAKAA